MRDALKNDEPAFPVPGLHQDPNFNGMSLRDYFAGQAMVGFMSNRDTMDGIADGGRRMSECLMVVSRLSYLAADSMLKAREC